MQTFWHEQVTSAIKNVEKIDVFVPMLISEMYENKLTSTEEAISALSLEDQEKKLAEFTKSSLYTEAMKHLIIPMQIERVPFSFRNLMAEVQENQILDFFDTMDQLFPTYAHPVHVAATDELFQFFLNMYVKHYYGEKAPIVNGTYYATGALLQEVLSPEELLGKLTYAVDNESDVITNEFHVIKVLKKAENKDYASFTLQSGKTTRVLLGALPTCIISSLSNSLLTGRNELVQQNTPLYFVTIHDIENSIQLLKNNPFVTKEILSMMEELLDTL